MNAIRQIQLLNKRELEASVTPEASWHADYRDTAYIYVGGLPYDLSEGDILTIFSQFGEPVHLNLVRDKETGKSRGFAFLKYEDQRSTDLAVDNLTGATVLGRVLRVDHVRYKRREDEGTADNLLTVDENASLGARSRSMSIDSTSTTESLRKRGKRGSSHLRKPSNQERELRDIIDNHDDEDPMKQYLINQKKEQMSHSLQKHGRDGDESINRSNRHSSRRHRHHRHHRDGDADSDVEHGYGNGHARHNHRGKDKHRIDYQSSHRHRHQHKHQHSQSERHHHSGHSRNSRDRYVTRERDLQQLESADKRSQSPESSIRPRDRQR